MRLRRAASSGPGSVWCPNRCPPAIARSSAAYRCAAIATYVSCFVQAAWVVLVKVGPEQWERYGLKSWIEAAKAAPHGVGFSSNVKHSTSRATGQRWQHIAENHSIF